jgi:hypothetical protein
VSLVTLMLPFPKNCLSTPVFWNTDEMGVAPPPGVLVKLSKALAVTVVSVWTKWMVDELMNWGDDPD